LKRNQLLALITALLLLAAGLRFRQLGTLPPGFSEAELASLTITAHERQGQIMVFDGRAGSGEETFFHITQAVVASLTGDGLITLRLPAVWSGLITLALVFALARRLYGKRVALLAVALMAVSFWPVLLDRLSLRETYVPLFTTAVLLALINGFHIRRYVSPDPPTTTAYTILGISVAISLYVHWFGLVLAVIVTCSVIYLFVTRQHISRHAAAASIFAIVLSIIVIIPYLTNQHPYAGTEQLYLPARRNGPGKHPGGDFQRAGGAVPARGCQSGL
jgi:4-amino-4-deoxy-L-arabinose transferase-like glycosyltransferase